MAKSYGVQTGSTQASPSMIRVIRICRKCGAKILSDAPEGLCGRCVLKAALGNFQDASVAGGGDPGHADEPTRDEANAADGHSKKPARAAELLGELGDYELLEEVGRGGQGVVFRARQKSLNRIVGLKVISLGQWASKAHLRRFRLEAEAAAKLEHPGIVPIHEVGERGGSCYFSMKFIEGGQLDEVVKREPMPIRRAVELIAKVARTVHYAHEHGILHRDIKPGNILLDQKGEPHLTDFGLARLVESESSVTQTLDVLGTPSYMAPEQAVGNNAAVSSVTDVYGLGAVLYQLLTSQPPFAGGATYETIKLLLDTEPRSPRLLNPKIDRDLSTICLKCLEKDPKRRYSSALALAEDLERYLKHQPICARRSGLFTHGRKWVQRNRSTAVLVTLLVLLAAGLSATLWRHKPAILIPKSVAILPFENLSDDPDNSYFADGIQEEVLTRLASIEDLKVISHTSTQRYRSKPGNLPDIARQLGVANIVEGSVQKTADQVRVNVQLINAQTDSHLWADTYDRKLTDLFTVESEIAKRIAESLQAKLSGQEEQALALKPTSNAEAYEAYLRGLSFEARSTFSDDALERAIGFFERTVELDRNFALAWARLSRAHAVLYFDWAPTVARRESARRALENAQKLQPSAPETLLALGYYQYRVLRDYGAATTTFARVSKILPGTSEVPHVLGLISRREGHWEQSIACFEQALALDPRNTDLLIHAAETYGMLRQFPAALKLYDRALDIMPNNPDVLAGKASMYQAQGDLQQAARLLLEVNWQTSSESTIQFKITQLRLERNYDEAVRLLRARQNQFHFASDYEKASDYLALAFMQRVGGDTAGAKVTAEQARNTLEQFCGNQPDNVGCLVALSQAYAAIGANDAALKTAERALLLLPSVKDAITGPGLEENLALIQAIAGENSRAIPTLTRLLQTPYNGSYLPPITPALLRLDPIWDSLRSDPRFQELCRDNLEKSIAVLPFENLTPDPGNSYFAEGIQDEILTRLASIADLKVVSRTSAQRYQSKPRNLAEIAKQLGVANIVEGSVQKATDQVRVNVQLINARTDSHLWADTYDRKLTDIFLVESEVAKAIADQLKAKLTGQEKQIIVAKPTDHPEAYDAYLRGLAYDLKPELTTPDFLAQQKCFREAVRLDPKFALAWAALSNIDSAAYLQKGLQPTVALREEARQAAETALALKPNLGEAILAKGLYYYSCLKDYDTAVRYFEQARQFLPNRREIPELLGYVARRRGQWDRNESYFNEAERLDPLNLHLLTEHANSYFALRRFPEAVRKLDQVLAIAPGDVNSLLAKADIAQTVGDLPRASALLAPLQANHDNNPDVLWPKIRQAMLERRPDQIRLIIPRLQELLTRADQASGYYNGGLRVLLGWAHEFAGDHAAAQESWRRARSELEPFLEEQPEDEGLLRALAMANLGLGDKSAAQSLAERAMAALPLKKDAYDGIAPIWTVARVAARSGEPDRAIAALQKLLSIPSGFTAAGFWLDPMFDPLRSDPRFQKFRENKQP
jgi:TolB-like protein/Tfp pilus assembly protein PilF